jgi:hypothetical protein
MQLESLSADVQVRDKLEHLILSIENHEDHQFLDTEWCVPGLMLSHRRFERLCSQLGALASSARRAGHQLNVETVSELLLDARCLFTPSQARRFFNSLREFVVPTDDNVDWGVRDQCDRAIFTLLTSFFARPHRWCNMPLDKRYKFWGPEESDNGSIRCYLANSTPSSFAVLQPRPHDRASLPPYALALSQAHQRGADRRALAAAILSQQLPQTVRDRHVSALQRRPPLPVEICGRILADADWLIDPPIHPATVDWLNVCGETWVDLVYIDDASSEGE